MTDRIDPDARRCPITGCGSTVRFAFPNSTRYVTCRRNGHVTLTDQPWVISVYEVENDQIGANVGVFIADDTDERDQMIDRIEAAWPTLRVVIQRAHDPSNIPA